MVGQQHSESTIVGRFNPRDNAFNVLRLALAVLVIVSHSQPTGGFGPDPRVGDLNLGQLAVGGFFAVSGFLITASRLQSSLLGYAWRRARRIMPGFWVCLIVTAFVAAPLAGLARGGWNLGSAVEYVVEQSMLYRAGSYSIGETLVGMPYSSTWNASLWTLFYEALCYVVVGVMLCFAVVRRRPWVTLAVFIGASCASALSYALGTPGTAGLFATFLPWFLAGAVLLRYGNRIRLTGPWAAATAVVFGVLVAVGMVRVLGPLPVAYLCLWLGVALPAALRRRCTRHDVSYGMYLYAFPVQQLLFVAGVHHLGAFTYTVVSIASTVPLAWASWLWVERPVQRFKPRQLLTVHRRLQGASARFTTRRRDGATPPSPV